MATPSPGCARRRSAPGAADRGRPPGAAGASLSAVIPDRRIAFARARRSLRDASLFLVASALLLAACSALLETPPAPTPADFAGISGDMTNLGITVDHVVSGDAGCDDPILRQTAIAFDAHGLDQAMPTRVYVYIFGDRDAFNRLRQTIDTCARSSATDPSAFESVEASPFVVAGPGPWGPRFKDAIRKAVTVAAGPGG